jgi:hypothetical protein
MPLQYQDDNLCFFIRPRLNHNICYVTRRIKKPACRTFPTSRLNTHDKTHLRLFLLLRRRFFLPLNRLVHLFAMHRYMLRRSYPKPNLVSSDIDYRYFHVVAYYYRFIFLSTQHQHRQLLLQIGPLYILRDERINCSPATILIATPGCTINSQIQVILRLI